MNRIAFELGCKHYWWHLLKKSLFIFGLFLYGIIARRNGWPIAIPLLLLTFGSLLCYLLFVRRFLIVDDEGICIFLHKKTLWNNIEKCTIDEKQMVISVYLKDHTKFDILKIKQDRIAELQAFLTKKQVLVPLSQSL